MDIDAYLARLGLTARPDPTLAGITALQQAHLYAVPFENLDIALGHGIHMDRAHLFDKVVRRRRGGYCFELNVLFGDALAALGFTARPLMARVWVRNPETPPAATHIVQEVTIEGTAYLVDVAFGGSGAQVPMPIAPGVELVDAHGPIRLEASVDHGLMFVRETPDGPQQQFSFTPGRVYESDLEMANHFTSTAPQSHFTQLTLAGRYTPEGRIGLVDRTLTYRRGTAVEERQLARDQDVLDVLLDAFGIDLGDEGATLLRRLPRGEMG